MRNSNVVHQAKLVVSLIFLLTGVFAVRAEEIITGWDVNYNPNSCDVGITEGNNGKLSNVQPVPGIVLKRGQQVTSPSCQGMIKTVPITLSELPNDFMEFIGNVGILFTSLLNSHPGVLAKTGTPMSSNNQPQCVPMWANTGVSQKIVKQPEGQNSIHFGLSENCNGKPSMVEIFKGKSCTQWEPTSKRNSNFLWEKPAGWKANRGYTPKDVVLDLNFADSKAKCYKVKMSWQNKTPMEVIVEGISTSELPHPKGWDSNVRPSLPAHFLAVWLQAQKGQGDVPQWALEAYQRVVSEKEPVAWLIGAKITHPEPIK